MHLAERWPFATEDPEFALTPNLLAWARAAVPEKLEILTCPQVAVTQSAQSIAVRNAELEVYASTHDADLVQERFYCRNIERAFRLASLKLDASLRNAAD